MGSLFMPTKIRDFDAVVKQKRQFKPLHLFGLNNIRIKDIRPGMDVVFADPQLALVETEDAGKTKLPVSVIQSARRKLTVLRAAIDDRSLRNWKSLHYEKLKRDRDG